MKKIITIAALVILSISSTFANDGSISKKAQAVLSETFAKATNVKWEKMETYYKASFQENGQSLNALLTTDGEIIAVSKNILSNQLPIYLQSSLDLNLSSSWITELAEYAIGDTTTYYATIENADEIIIFESAGTSEWTVAKKIAK